MAADVVTISGKSQHLRFKIDTSGVQETIQQQPVRAYRSIRNFLFEVLRDHRLGWLRAKGLRFGRGGRGIKVFRINEKLEAGGVKDVVYRVLPKERTTTKPNARAMLGRLRSDIFTGSVVLRVHQFGEDIRSSNDMFIPVKTRGGIRAFLAKGKRMAVLPGRKPGTRLFYEVQGKRKRKLRLRFVATKFVDMKRTLLMYETWELLRSARDILWKVAADTMTKVPLR